MLSLEFFVRAKTHAFFNVVYVYTIYVVSKIHKDSYDVLCLTCQKGHGWVTSVKQFERQNRTLKNVCVFARPKNQAITLLID